ncbi:superoxide dismutase [Rhodothalassium salexigens]|nr:superoxide dismutase [Rhodothalassium salexigens]
MPRRPPGGLPSTRFRYPTEEDTTVLTLPDLPYDYKALEPYMSAETLEYHHDKHHNAYVTAGNKLMEGTPYADMDLESAIRESFKSDPKLFNQIAQHWNHMEFWHWMSPKGGGAIPGNLESQIKKDFGSVDDFKEAFVQAGVTQFGSGWCWLVWKDGKLAVTQTPNGENPLVHGGTALLGCDVWEHSYYIDYRNARPKYLEAFFDHLVNWERVTEIYERAS